MARQIYKAKKTKSTAESMTRMAESQEEKYFERLMKLIPAETVAAYLFLDGILRSVFPEQSGELHIWLWIIFGILFIGNILYLIKVSGVKDITEIIILALGFAVWVFTLGGPFSFLSFYRPFLGSIILVLFTFFIPIFYKGMEPVE